MQIFFLNVFWKVREVKKGKRGEECFVATKASRGHMAVRGRLHGRVFDEGNSVAVGYHEVSSNFVGHRLRRLHNMLCHPLRG